MGKPPWPRDPPPPSRRGHLGQNVLTERLSDPRPDFRCTRSRFRSVDCACHILTQKPRPSLGSQTSVLSVLAHKPSSLAIQNYNAALCLPSRRKTLLSGATQEPQMRINGARHSAVPQIYRLTWALMPFLSQPDPGPPGPTQSAGRTLSTSDPSWS